MWIECVVGGERVVMRVCVVRLEVTLRIGIEMVVVALSSRMLSVW